MWVGLSVWIFKSFLPIFWLYCLPLSAPGSELENYDKRKISPWLHFAPHSSCKRVGRDRVWWICQQQLCLMDSISKASVCGFYSLSGIGRVIVGKKPNNSQNLFYKLLSLLSSGMYYTDSWLFYIFLNFSNLVQVLSFLGQRDLGDNNLLL